MAGTLTITPIETSPKQPAAALTFNKRFTEITNGVTGHYQGTMSRHLVGELDSPITDDHVTAPPLNVAATDQHTRNLQFLTLLGQLADPTVTSIDAFQKIAQLVASGVNMKSLGSAITGRTPLATPSTTVARGANAEAAFGSLNVFGFGTQNATELRLRPVSGQTVPVLVIENQAGTQTKWSGDAAGNTFQGANATIQGVILAGSGSIQITTIGGFIDSTKVSGIIPAGNLPVHTGDVTTVAGSMATTVAAVGGKTATAVANATTRVENASATGAASQLVVFNASSGFSTTGTIAATTFQGALTGNVTGNVSGNAGTATNVAAAGITGTIQASQIDTAIARTVNVPNLTGTNASGSGAPASGTWGISITGNAATATVASGVVPLGVTTGMIADAAVTGPKLALGAIAVSQLGDGVVTQASPTPNQTVSVGPLNRIGGQGKIIKYQGGSVNLAPSIAAMNTPSQNRYVVIAVNAVPEAYYIEGAPIVGTLGLANLPQVGVDSAVVAIVTLHYNQTQILTQDIEQFKDAFSYWGNPAAGGSPVGHIHGQSQGESLVSAIGLMEGFAHPTSPTRSKSIVIEQLTVPLTSGAIQTVGQGSLAIPDATNTFTVFPIYVSRQTAQYVIGTPVSGASLPALPAFDLSHQVPICYVVNKLNAGYIRGYNDSSDPNGGYLLDARVWMSAGGSGGPGSAAGIGDGGTGQTTFPQGLIWQSSPTVGTTPLATIPAMADATRGLAINPQVNGPSGTQAVFQNELGGGIANGATALTRMVNAHVVTPTKTGSTALEAVTLQVEAAAGGTSNAAAVFGGFVKIGATTMPAQALDVAGNAVISGTLSSGAFTPASVGVTGNATVGGTLAVTGVTTLNNSVNVVGASSNLSVGGTLAVTGTSTLTGRVTSTVGVTVSGGGIDVTGTSALRGAVTVTTGGVAVQAGGVNVVGTSLFWNAVRINNSTAPANPLSVSGNVDISGTLGVNTVAPATHIGVGIAGNLTTVSSIAIGISAVPSVLAAQANAVGYGINAQPTISAQGQTGISGYGGVFSVSRPAGDTTGTVAQTAAVYAIAASIAGSSNYAAILSGPVVINGASASLNNAGLSVLGATSIGSNGFASQDAYITDTMFGSWVSGGTPPARRQSRPDTTWVHRGLVTGGVGGTQALDLGAGYPPGVNYWALCNGNNQAAVGYSSGSGFYIANSGASVTYGVTFTWQN